MVFINELIICSIAKSLQHTLENGFMNRNPDEKAAHVANI